nr:MAG TPA: hypothetical protein [Caudoviricetes sp.]
MYISATILILLFSSSIRVLSSIPTTDYIGHT